jgi:hypothetical protein
MGQILFFKLIIYENIFKIQDKLIVIIQRLVYLPRAFIYSRDVRGGDGAVAVGLGGRQCKNAYSWTEIQCSKVQT